MKIALIPGIHARHGGMDTVGKLMPFLEAAGHVVIIIDYGDYNVFDVIFRKHRAVRLIAEQLKTVDAVVSHSNGGNFEHKALKLLQRRLGLYRVVRIAPALNRRTGAAQNVEKCVVFFSRTDFWVWVSAFLPFSPWGRQGQKGYKGRDTRIESWNMTDVIPDHSDYFDDDTVEFTAKECLLALEQP